MIKIKGYSNYFYKDSKIYKKAVKVKCKLVKWQYRKMIEIKKIQNNGVFGYFLVKNGKRKWINENKIRLLT